jgi:hypothetical protein
MENWNVLAILGWAGLTITVSLIISIGLLWLLDKIEESTINIYRKKLVLALDYDGTVASGNWPDSGILKRNMLWFYKWAVSRGHILILWTCREGNDLQLALAYLKSQGIDFKLVNRNDPERMEFYKNDTRKIGADWYFDDKAGFINWEIAFLIVLWLEWKYRKCY